MNNGVFLGMKMIRNGWLRYLLYGNYSGSVGNSPYFHFNYLVTTSIRYMKLENQKLKYEYTIMVRNGHK